MVNYADRMRDVKPSDIREILKYAVMPEIISFAGGLPAPELFPVEEIKEAACRLFDEAGQAALQYGPTDGYYKLREQIAERMSNKNGIKTDSSNILLTTGSQQGLDLAARIFVNPGDVMILESPSYLGAINAFVPCRPNFVECPTDDNGLIMEELEKILATTENVKLIYVIPDFQNPSGRSWPLERRQKFMEIITKYEIPVLEDNPYGELRFRGEYLPSLKSMDKKDLVIYLGTFSKIWSPGIRLGWVCAGKAYLEKFNLLMQAACLQSSTTTAMLCSKYLELYDIDEHVEKIRKVYKHRCDVMIEAIQKYFPEGVKYTIPDGGLFTWVELPDYIDTKVMAPEAIEQKVAYVPGIGFFPNKNKHNCMRLNYSNMPDERIVEGIKRLAQVIKNNMK